MSRTRKGRETRPLASLFERVLPADFARQRVLIEQYQQFFNSLDGDLAFRAVKVLHVGDRELAVALPSPAYATWLRQQQAMLEQTLTEQFGRHLQLRITVDPAMMSPERPQPRLPEAEPVSEETRQRIERSAGNLEDEELARALQRLARSLGRKHGH